MHVDVDEVYYMGDAHSRMLCKKHVQVSCVKNLMPVHASFFAQQTCLTINAIDDTN